MHSRVGLSITGVEAINLLVNTSSVVTNQDVYTVPAGKRLYIEMFNPLLPSGGAHHIVTPSINKSGIYYPICRGTSTISSNSLTGIWFIAEAGDKLAVSTTGAASTNIFFKGMLFDNTSNIRSVFLPSFTAGNNTLYTCPPATTAFIADLAAINSISPYNPSCFIFNFSGSTRTITTNIVPNGNSVSNSNKIVSSPLVNTVGGQFFLCSDLTPGDFVNITTDSSAALQYAWITIIEV